MDLTCGVLAHQVKLNLPDGQLRQNTQQGNGMGLEKKQAEFHLAANWSGMTMNAVLVDTRKVVKQVVELMPCHEVVM